MMKKLMSLGLVGILSASLMVGCSSNNDSKDDDTVTIKYVDENGNVKQEKVTKERAQQIEEQQKKQPNDTTKKEQPKKETTKTKDSEDDMSLDEMYEKGLIKKHGGHLEEEAKEQEKKHEQEDQEQQGKYPICYDEDGTQINDEYGNYTPEYEQKKQEEWNRHENYDDDEDYPNKDVHDSCIDPEDTSNTDNDVEESPSEPVENN